MTSEAPDRSSVSEEGRFTSHPRSFGRILERTKTRLRQDPFLVLPFLVAGVVVGLADATRAWDPIPVTTPDWTEQSVSIQYSFFPSGPARTVRELGAFVDLRPTYALGAVALEAVVFLAVGLAGWLTITRALDADRRLDSLGRYLGVFLLLGSIPVLLGPTSVTFGSLPLILLGLAIFSYASVRLFLFPSFVASDDPVSTALEHSIRASMGLFWPLLSLVILFGIGYWVVGLVPYVGSALSTGVVAPIHAVTLAVLAERAEWMTSRE
jgi:hypothetical protein